MLQKTWNGGAIMGRFVQKPVLKWHLEGDPVPVAERIMQLVTEKEYHPVALLRELADHIPPYDYEKSRTILSDLLFADKIVLTPDWKLVTNTFDKHCKTR
jgi:hypothetical protein